MEDETSILRISRIVAVGISGSGSNIIKNMMNKKIPGIELIIVETDEQNSYESLHQTLEGADVVFLIVGLGGITGIYTTPIIAKIAKSVGALTVSVVSKPFTIEGSNRLGNAEEALEKLNRVTDSMIVIPNDKLLTLMNPDWPLDDAFKFIDDVVARVINGISGVILPSGEEDINLDYIDLETIMTHQGLAGVGIGEYQGNNAAYEAINDAIKFPMVDGVSIENASGVLVHFSMHPEFHFMELSAAMEVIHKSVAEHADVIFGTTTDKSLPLDFIRVTIIPTGIEKIPMKAANNVY
jgi:cell division protein FtsZ